MRSRRFARPTIRHATICSAPLLVLALAQLAHADDAINPDRPGLVESSNVVGQGRFQVETGFSSERSKADGIKDRLNTSPMLLRMGLNDTLELRVETDGATRLRSENTNTGITTRERGYSDVAIGVKWHTHDGNDAGMPSMAWLLHADLETGSRAFRGEGVRPSLRFVAEWDLPNDWSFGVMPGVFVDKNEDGDRYMGSILALSVGKAVNDRVNTYIELAGHQLASSKNGGNVVTWGTGASYLVTNDVQVDVNFSWGVTKEAPDFGWGVGMAFRF
ncbi:MAG: transporter [Pseudomonadota bacterium]